MCQQEGKENGSNAVKRLSVLSLLFSFFLNSNLRVGPASDFNLI